MIARYGKREVELPLVERDGKVVIHHSETFGPVENMKKLAKTIPAYLPPTKFDSKTEAAYDAVLKARKQAGEIADYWHHPLTLILPGGVRYTPDFLVASEAYPNAPDALQFLEVKGWSKNRRDGITRLKVASGCVPWATFKLIERVKGEWIETEIRP